MPETQDVTSLVGVGKKATVTMADDGTWTLIVGGTTVATGTGEMLLLRAIAAQSKIDPNAAAAAAGGRRKSRRHLRKTRRSRK